MKMAKSIKLQDDNYIDTSGIVHNRIVLSKILTPTTLFSGEKSFSGSGTQAINDDCEEYARIDTLWLVGTDYTITTMYPPYDKDWLVLAFGLGSYLRGARFSISGKTLTVSQTSYNRIYGTSLDSGAETVKLIKVVGYK